jgi:hypothetical protein
MNAPVVRICFAAGKIFVAARPVFGIHHNRTVARGSGPGPLLPEEFAMKRWCGYLAVAVFCALAPLAGPARGQFEDKARFS